MSVACRTEGTRVPVSESLHTSLLSAADRMTGEILAKGVWPARDGARDFLVEACYEMLACGLVEIGPAMNSRAVF